MSLPTPTFTLEKSKTKSGADRVKVLCSLGAVETCNLNVLWEDMGPDGNLGKFGITDPRGAAYTMTLCADSEGHDFPSEYKEKEEKRQSEFMEFVRSTANAGVEFMLDEGLLKKPVDQARSLSKKLFKTKSERDSYVRESILSGATLPIGTDDRTGTATLKLKKRLCKWTPEGEEPQRSEMRVYTYDGVRFERSEDKINRGDYVRPRVEFSFWATPSAYGMSMGMRNVLLLRKGAKAKSAVEFSVPDLPIEPACKRAKVNAVEPRK